MTHSETGCYDFGMSETGSREVDSATPATPRPVAFPSPSQPGQCEANPRSRRVSSPLAAPVLPGGTAGSRSTTTGGASGIYREAVALAFVAGLALYETITVRRRRQSCTCPPAARRTVHWTDCPHHRA